MKKSGNKNILYAVWGILCAATAFLGGFSHSMPVSYTHLEVCRKLSEASDEWELGQVACRYVYRHIYQTANYAKGEKEKQLSLIHI